MDPRAWTRGWRPAGGAVALLLAGACSRAPAANNSGGEEPPPAPGAARPWVAGYYVGYQQTLQPEASIDFSAMTHVIVGRVLPTPAGGVLTHFDIDDAAGPAMARRVSELARRAGRPALLMVGGAGAREAFAGAASGSNRAAFVARLLAAMDALGYDGLDVDWEPIRPEDRAPLLALLQDLRAARPGMLLTLPVEWANTGSPGGVSPWYAQAAQAVDRVNVMSYGMAGAWNGWQSWHSSALTGHAPPTPSSVDGAVQAYLAAGVPAWKLGVGAAFSGSCWRGVTGPRQPTAGAAVVAGDNVMSYATIMARYHTPAAARWDTAAQVPWLTFAAPAGPAGCTFVSYEDAASIRAKGAYVRERGLGGVIVWTVSQGHLPSAPASARDPLLRAVYDAVAPPGT